MSQKEDFKVTDLEHEAEWYFASKTGKNEGPYMVTEIRAFYENGKIDESTFVWNTLWNHSDWIPIKLIKHLYPKIFFYKSQDKNKIDEQIQIDVLARVQKDADAVVPIVEKEILNKGEEMVLVTSTREKEIVGNNGLSAMTNNNAAVKVTENLEFESKSKLPDVGAVKAVGSLEHSDSQYLKNPEKDPEENEQPQLDATFSVDKLDSVMDQLKAFELEMEQYNSALKNMDMVIGASSISGISGKEQSRKVDGDNTDMVGLEGSDLPTQEKANELASLATQKETRVKKECSSKIEVFSEEYNSSVYQPKTESHVIPSASSEIQIQEKESPQHLMEDISSEEKKPEAERRLSESFSIFLSGDQLHKVPNITPMHSILQLRKIAGQRENIPVNLVMLLYKDIVLDNEMSLKDYNIESGGTLVVKFNEPVIKNGGEVDNEPSKPPRDEAPPPYCPVFDEFDPGIIIDCESNISENLKTWKSTSPVPAGATESEKPLTPKRKASPSSHSLSERLIIHKPLPARSASSTEEMRMKPLPVFSSSLGSAAPAFSPPKSLSEVKSEDDLALEAYPENQRESITALENWGFPRDSVIVALELTKFSKEHAVHWLLSKEYKEHKKLDKKVAKKAVEESKERGVQSEAKAEKQERDWNCPACTLLNSNAVHCCTICGTPKSGNRKQHVPLELDYRKPQDAELEIPAENLSHAPGNMPIAPVKKREKKVYGNYRVRILRAVGIDQKANYCLLSLGKATKRTKTLKKAKMLYFNDVFYFTGVKADRSLQLRISLMAKKLRADKVVGQVSYAMPTFFNRECQDFLELINAKNEPSGNITISVIFKQGPMA